MPKHVVRLLSLMAVGLVLALVAKWIFTPDSFYRFGHYRADSVVENAALEPVHMTSGYCEKCHDDRYAEWSASNHKSVACENCHGPGKGHPRGGKKKLPIHEDTIRHCSLCHEATAGRPARQPQVVLAEHAAGEQCAGCHNPHSPRISADVKLSGKVDDGKALATKACASCHGAAGIGSSATWPNLAGLSAKYLVKMTSAYRAGELKHVVITPLGKKLSDQDVQDLAAYYASLPCGGSAAGAGRGDVAAGKTLAKNCARCHGESGVPTISSWPLIAGQAPGYLVNALKAFRAGLREDPMMSTASNSLSDADITNLAAFYSAQKCGPDK